MNTKPQDFVERSSLRGGLALFRDWSAIILVSVFSIRANNFIIYALSVWVIGYFQFAIGEALLHEASHYNLFRKKQWNNSLEFLYALPFFLTISQFRAAHSKHHTRFGSEQDHIIKDYKYFGFFKPTRNIFWLWFVKPVIGYAGYYYVSSFSLLPSRSGIKIVVFWILAVFAFWQFGSLQYLLLYWIIPYVLAYCSFMYWSEVQDHYNTRSGTRSNLSFLANLVTHNNGYHFTHHQYPTIPWYRLRAAHKALCPEGTDISHGFFDTYEQLKAVEGKERIYQRQPM